MIKKDNPTDPPIGISQLCGGLGLQVKKTAGYFDMKWPDTVKMWQQNWFYAKMLLCRMGTLGYPDTLQTGSSSCLGGIQNSPRRRKKTRNCW